MTIEQGHRFRLRLQSPNDTVLSGPVHTQHGKRITETAGGERVPCGYALVSLLSFPGSNCLSDLTCEMQRLFQHIRSHKCAATIGHPITFFSIRFMVNPDFRIFRND